MPVWSWEKRLDVTVHLEFYGIPRQRAGVASIDVEADTLPQALRQAAIALPDFARDCLDGKHLRSDYLANVNGRSFTSIAETPLQPGDTVLILSADAGG